MIFINKFKQNIKNLIKIFEEIWNKLNRTSNDIDRVFNIKKLSFFDIQKFIIEEVRLNINNNFKDIKTLFNYIKFYLTLQTNANQ